MTDLVMETGQGGLTAIEREIQVDDQTCLRARSAAILDRDQNTLGAVTVIQDISRQKELDRMKSDFVIMVSHELKAPLAAIMQQLEVLLGGMTGELNDRQAHFLSRARIRAQSMLDLINELLNLGRAETGREQSRQEPLDLVPIVRNVLEFLRPQALAKDQILEDALPAGLPPGFRGPWKHG